MHDLVFVDSSQNLLLTHFGPIIVGYLLFLKHSRHVSTLRALYLLFTLAGQFFT